MLRRYHQKSLQLCSTHSRSHVLQLLLGGDLAVVLDADVLVVGESVDLVLRERGTVAVSLGSTFGIVGWCHT